MKTILKDISRVYFKTNEDNQKLMKYHALTRAPEWEMYKEFLLLIRGTIAEQMFSKDFTELGSREKDIRQRTYANMNEVINFLFNPLKGIESEVKFKQHNAKMEATHGKQPKASKK